MAPLWQCDLISHKGAERVLALFHFYVYFSGRCSANGLTNHTTPHLEWAYDYCPSKYAWMAVFGLVLYLAFFAPGRKISALFALCQTLQT